MAQAQQKYAAPVTPFYPLTLLLVGLLMRISGGYGGSCDNCISAFYDDPSFQCNCQRADGSWESYAEIDLGKLFRTFSGSYLLILA
jgi:hypothetical protein